LCQPRSLEALRGAVASLNAQADRLDSNQLKKLLSQIVPEYRPQFQAPEVLPEEAAAVPVAIRFQKLAPRPAEVPELRPQLQALEALMEMDKAASNPKLEAIPQ
jgi:hypothetical protein